MGLSDETSERIFNIHGACQIKVGENVDSNILKNIEFQIGHFSTGVYPESFDLVIKPFSEHPVPRNKSIFHNYCFISGKYLENNNLQTAVEKKNGKYIVYTGNPQFLINIYIQLLLIKSNMTLIHAAGVSIDNSGLILAGGGGVGKTALSSNLVQKDNYRYLGDDIVILSSDGKSLSFPRSVVLKEYHSDIYPEYFDKHKLDQKNILSKSYKYLINLTYKNAPFVGMIKKILKHLNIYRQTRSKIKSPAKGRYLAAPPINELYQDNEITTSTKLDSIIYMERHHGSEFELVEVSNKQLVNRLTGVIHHEWTDYMREFYTLSASEIFELPGYFSSVEKIMIEAIKQKECYVLKIPEGILPSRLYTEFKKLNPIRKDANDI